MMERKHRVLMQRFAAFVFNTQLGDYKQRVSAVADLIATRYVRSTKEFLNYFWFCLQKLYHQRYATVEFAGHLDLQKLAEVLHQTVDFSECEIVASECPEVIGGFKIKLGDNVLDCTLKAQLNELVNTLK